MECWDARHDGEKIDLAFIVDCTGSMGSYINQVQKHVQHIAETISRTAYNVRLALIEYRDHPPQDRSFVTRVHDFTGSVPEMKTWVDGMNASGGGDFPEAVADGLYEASKLSYRKEATKMCVLIADAPPHGLEQEGDGFKDGCPKGHDPLAICHSLAEKEITLYCIGCEPINSFRDFLIALSAITGGQYVSLRNANSLTKVIINGVLEEVSLEKLMGVTIDYLHLKLLRNKAEKKTSTVDELAQELHKHLTLTNNQGRQMRINENALPELTDTARQYSSMTQMSQARRLHEYNKGKVAPTSCQGLDVNDVVGIMDNLHITPQQSQKLVTKGIARQKYPVTHCEKKNQVIVGTIPKDLN